MGHRDVSMITATNLVLLRKLRETTRRLFELELADYDRQINEGERAERLAIEEGKRTARNAPGSAKKNEVIMLRTMQEAGVPLRAAEIRARLGGGRATIARWLTSAIKQGYVERVDGARYQVRKEVPTL